MTPAEYLAQAIARVRFERRCPECDSPGLLDPNNQGTYACTSCGWGWRIMPDDAAIMQLRYITVSTFDPDCDP